MNSEVDFYYLFADICSVIINSPPHKKRKQSAANWAASYFSTTTLKGYTVNPYSKGSKNIIDVVFHKGGMPPESRRPVMSLDLGEKAL